MDTRLQPAPRRTAARQAYARALAWLAARPDGPLAVSLGNPFCTTRCLHCAREVQVAADTAAVDRYVDALVREMAAVARAAGGRREVLQLRLGGGSATELQPRHQLTLMDALHRLWRVPDDAELSVVCDPRGVRPSTLRWLRGLGFCHLHLTVPDLDPVVQRAIGRCQSWTLVDDACAMARDAGLRHITLDVTLGLPFQDAPGLARTLGQVMRLGVERVRLLGFSPAPERHAPQRGLPLYALPDGPTRGLLESTARQLLGDAGYRELGDLHFVLDDDPLAWAADDGVLHQGLLGFSEMRPLAVLGLGAGAVGEIDGQRFVQAPTRAAWAAAVAASGLGVQCAVPVPPRRQAAA